MAVLYAVFLVATMISAVMGLIAIWIPGVMSKALVQVLGTCLVVAVASALTLSATRVMRGAPPSEDS